MIDKTDLTATGRLIFACNRAIIGRNRRAGGRQPPDVLGVDLGNGLRVRGLTPTGSPRVVVWILSHRIRFVVNQVSTQCQAVYSSSALTRPLPRPTSPGGRGESCYPSLRSS